MEYVLVFASENSPISMRIFIPHRRRRRCIYREERETWFVRVIISV